MRYFYFISYAYNNGKSVVCENTVVDTKKKIKDSNGVQQLIDRLREQGNHDSVNIQNLSLIHKQWFT